MRTPGGLACVREVLGAGRSGWALVKGLQLRL